MDSGIRSDFFASHVGVRQGENLSPLLFALFLNVLDTFFTKQKWDTLDYIDKLYSDCNNNVSRNWKGSFVKAKQLLHDKASKAMYSLIQKGRRLKLPTDIIYA